MFNFIKDKLKKIYSTVTEQAHRIFSRTVIDEETLKELKTLLIAADTGVTTTSIIITNLTAALRRGTIAEGRALKEALEEQLLLILNKKPYQEKSQVFMLIGINGSGKTTFASKLAHKLTSEGKKVLFVAADTFRAAATQQLSIWAERLGVECVVGAEDQDPASVVFAGCAQFKNGNYDALIIDTAGRLQTKTHLMRELEKIKKVAAKQLGDMPITILLTVDSMLGQNSFEQAKLFNECTAIDGIVLTKMDGTGKGGIVFAINNELNIPVAYISFGEQPNQLKLFNAQEYVHELLEL